MTIVKPGLVSPRRRNLVIVRTGLGFIFAPAIGTATLGIESKETGVASAVVNACQQIGGSIGLALLSTISASAAASYARTQGCGPGVAEATTIRGYVTAFWWAAGIFAIDLLASLVVLPSKVRTGECRLRKALSRTRIISSTPTAPWIPRPRRSAREDPADLSLLRWRNQDRSLRACGTWRAQGRRQKSPVRPSSSRIAWFCWRA